MDTYQTNKLVDWGDKTPDTKFQILYLLGSQQSITNKRSAALPEKQGVIRVNYGKEANILTEC